MFDFEKISIKQINLFFEIIHSNTLLSTESIERQYKIYSDGFSETVIFLNAIGLVSIKSKLFVLNSKFEIFLIRYFSSQETETIEEFILHKFAGEKNKFTESVDLYLSQFYLSEETCKFSVVKKQQAKFRGLRNIFMELGLVSLNSEEKTYFIPEEKQDLYLSLRKNKKLSIEHFQKKIKDREILGTEAELIILGFEKERLAGHPKWVEGIEHIAISDVGAGYDIKSYTLGDLGSESATPRHIEVKAVSQFDYKFFWTANELETAKSFQDTYYLYLLPISESGIFNLEGLEVVKNPYINIYKSQSWDYKLELVSCSLSVSSGLS